MSSNRTDIVCRSDKYNARLIDSSLKNPWCWDWIEKQVDGVYVKEVIRKISKCGTVYCILCSKEVMYGNRGFHAISNHIKSKKHASLVEARKPNFALPGKKYSF